MNSNHAILSGFLVELEKDAALWRGLKGVAGAARNVLTNRSKQTFSQRMGRLGKRTGQFIKQNPVATAAGAGTAALGAGYMVGRK